MLEGDQVSEHPAHRVVVQPSGVEIEVHRGETLMAAADRLGYAWPTSCEGLAVCTRCYITVPQEFAGSFSPMQAPEQDGLWRVRWRVRERPGERLACQVRLVADAEVVKRGVRSRNA